MTAGSPSYFAFPWCGGVVGNPSPATAAALTALARESVTDAAGNVALVGSWRPDELRTVSAGPFRATFLGTCRFSDADALAALERGIARRRYETLARLPGSFQLVVDTPDGVTLLPDSAGLRRLWYARADGCLLFATHALVLRRLLRSPVDDQWLATRLAAPTLRDASERRAPFVGVHGVAPGESVRLGRDLAVRAERWWSPPVPDTPLPVAAEALSATLSGAVEHRVAAARRPTCDLSGGLDSTSLAFIAAGAALAHGRELVTVTRTPASPANDDPVWAARVVDALGGTEHLELGEEALSLPYADLSTPPPLDEPDPAVVLLGWMRHQAARLAGVGSDVHLAGNGGDQVLGTPLAYLRGLAMRRPLLALRHVRGHRALTGLPWRSVRELMRTGSYADWLVLAAREAGRGGQPPQTWARLPQAPPGLLTRDCLASAEELLLEAAGVAPQVRDVARHGAVLRLRHTAGVHRLHRDTAASLGVRLELPFLDADVAERCLSARAHERVDPRRPKPLLVAAMRGIVPDELLARTTMGVYDTELHLGWRRHRREVATLLRESRLADRGLVTREGLAAAVEGSLDTSDLFALNEVLAAELWLRSLEASDFGTVDRPATAQAHDAGGDQLPDQIEARVRRQPGVEVPHPDPL